MISEFNLFISLLVCLFISFIFGLLFAKVFFKRNLVEASIAGLAVSFSAGPFYGPALLENIYGEKGDVAVTIISLILNIFILPLATIIIKCHIQTKDSNDTPIFKMILTSIYEAIVKTPFVWAPLLAFILVFLNIQMPSVVINSLDLIGKATAGVAIFVAGLTIAEHKFSLDTEIISITALKNIAVPILFFIVALLFHMKKGSATFNQGLLLAALPSGPIIVLLATRYKQYQKEAASILALSTFGMIITITAIITFLHI